jgi:hypothetical protein
VTATKEDLERWAALGVERGATHLIVACDTFDYESYPVYAGPGDDVTRLAARFDGPNMQQVDEVIDLRTGATDRDVRLLRRLDGVFKVTERAYEALHARFAGEEGEG